MDIPFNLTLEAIYIRLNPLNWTYPSTLLFIRNTDTAN